MLRKMSTAIIKKGNKYLMLKRSIFCKIYWFSWQFPEGGKKCNENDIQALTREIKEETNLKLLSCRLLGTYKSEIKYFGITFWNFERKIFSCNVMGDIKLSLKHSKYNWFEKNEIKKLKLMKSLDFYELEKYLK